MHSEYKKLTKEFYQQDAISVAKQLLGKVFTKIEAGTVLSGKIVEVEVYTIDDMASHSYGGKKNKNAVMFEGGGKLYVYFTYGMYYCCNVVTGELNEGSAVLIRALEPIEGIDTFFGRRFCKSIKNSKENKYLLNGPGKISIAFNLDKNFNGHDLTGDEIFISEDINKELFEIGESERIGISKNKELMRRFFIKDNLYLSKK